MLTGALFFTSCTEDTILEEHQIEMSGEGIYFGLTETNNSWEPDSRSAKKGDKFVMRSEESTDTLCVSTSTINGIHTSNDVQSRGVRKNDLVESGFNVTAYYYPAGASTPSSILFNEDVTVANDGSTGMTTTYYWPKEGGFTFLATANGDNNLTINDQNGEGFVTTPSLSYTVPGNVSDQKDAMVAFTGTTTINNNNNGAAVPLTFTHLCAAVQFQLTSEVENTIESIVISGVKGGTLTYTYSNGEWTPSTPTEDASYTINTTQDGTTITSDNNGTTLLLAPQTLTTDATITVNFSDGRAPVSTEARALTGNVWEMGKTFIYKLTITPEYTLEFTEVEEILDAHYIITTITFKTDVNWTIRLPEEPEGVTAKAYLSKEKSNTEEETETPNKNNEITTNQMAGMWSYVEKCNKKTISGTVTTEGEEENVTVYLLVRENASTTDRSIKVELLKTEEESGEAIDIKQLGYKAYDTTFAMERVEDAESPFGFTLNLGNVTYQYSAEGFWPWLISAVLTADGNIFTWILDVLNGPDNITVNLTTNVSGITNANSGLTNTSNASSLTLSPDQNYLIAQGWYTTNANINISETQTAFQYCLNKNSYGNFTGNNDDTNGAINIQWYLPAINEMLKITSQDTETGADQYVDSYWSSTAIDDKTNANSWSFGATTGTSTARTTSLKIRCARTITSN